MLTRLQIQGFKSWKDTGEMRLAPITALFGTNSSGKTSILQLLLMLKQTTESSDRSQVLDLGDDRALVELGTLDDILHSHDPESTLAWNVAWTLPSVLPVLDTTRRNATLFDDSQLGFSAQVARLRNGEGSGRAAVRRMAYQFADAEFGMRTSNPGERQYDLFTTRRDFKFLRPPGRAWKLPPPVKCYGFPDQVRAYYKNAGFLSDFELQLEEMMARVFYLGPLRDYPRRQYSWGGSQPSDMGRRGEKVVDALLASRETGEKIAYGKGRPSMTLEERVASWLKDLGLIESFAVRPLAKGSKLFQVWVRRQARASEVLLTDVGFGVSQILPVITLCYYVPKGSVILLEQPEIHLHPAVQAGLADVFIDAVKARGIQLVIESHSEHLLRRLQRRIAEEQVSADHAALYFSQIRDGTSTLVPLKLDAFGSIQNWPEGFFGDDFGEIVATQQAILERKLQAAA